MEGSDDDDYPIPIKSMGIRDLIAFGRMRELRKKIENTNFDVSACDHNWQTPLHIAAELDNIKAANLFMKNKCDIDAQDYDGNTPLCTAVLYNSKKVCKLLLESGANIYLKNKKDKNCLSLAVADRSNDDSLIKLILGTIKTRNNVDWNAIATWINESNCPVYLGRSILADVAERAGDKI